MAPKGAQKKAKTVFIIDMTKPADDEVIDPSAFEKFLHDKIKVGGKAGNLGDSVTVALEKSKIIVTATIPFSKRYLKYLTKKFLKKQQVDDYFHVVATKRDTYEVKFYKVQGPEEESEGED